MWKRKHVLDAIVSDTGKQLWSGACRVLRTLTEAGHEAYIIGGAVRDLLLQREPHDYDIVTAARPEEVIESLRNAGIGTTDLVGKAFGVVIAILPEGRYEVATFRGESYGADAHRPESVWYTTSLVEDVQRRDFTCNGIAMDETGHIYDLVEGRKDIKRRVLRTIGDATQRFSEDALRLFRACRFAAQLDMPVHDSLLVGMSGAFHRVVGLSFERVKQEVERLLLTDTPARGLDILVRSGLAECTCRRMDHGTEEQVAILPELSHLVDLPQEPAYHAYDGWYHTLASVQASPADLTIRWGTLLHDVGKGMPEVRALRKGRLTDYGHDAEGARLATGLLTRWGYPKALVQRVAWLVAQHMQFHYYAQHDEADAVRWVRAFARSGQFRYQADMLSGFQQLTEVCAADVLGSGRPHACTDGVRGFGAYLAEIGSRMPVHTSDLDYPKRLPQQLGKETAEVLQFLLKRVQDGQLANEPEALLAAGLRHYERRIQS